MTVLRAILLGCALMALLDGSVVEALAIVGLVVLLWWVAPDGLVLRRVRFRLRWRWYD